METHKLVMPEHLNHFGFLFGGNLLKWTDEIAYIAVTLDYPGCNFVTVGMDKIEFRKSIRQGTILCFDSRRSRTGNTSVEYVVDVTREEITTGQKELVFTTRITFVSVDEEGRKKPICRAKGG
ncbi:MAG: acyl-CoA thioesterase [Chlorobiaceae bacterium]|nr:acyl-CoA thioesterase [Chlorobiaceae bacterium]NTW73473.1 acyl-CoA thioesterase [Chlorobiaceae bacterium]